jgi:signal peptide peptidase SppA
MTQLDLAFDTRPVLSAGLQIDQYIGLWAVDDVRFLQMIEGIRRLDLASHIQNNASRNIAAAVSTVGRAGSTGANLAIVDIEGSLTKRGSSMSNAGSLIRLRQEIRRLADDPDIAGIMLRIDSPGGTVAGTPDLAAAVAAAAKKKPVHAFVEDFTASAAYWVASQASRIVANDRTAMVGSIGTFVGLYDFSAAAGQDGIKAIVIKSGKFKGAGFPGTEITQEQQAMWQELVDKTQSAFTAGVAQGRGLSVADVESLADGRVHVASDAVDRRLIDGIESFDAAMNALAAEADKKRKTVMSTAAAAPVVTEKKAATLAELKAACEGADAAFLMEQLEGNATVEAASGAWMKKLKARAEAAERDLAESKKTATAPGVRPLRSDSRKNAESNADEEEDDEEKAKGTASAEFWELVDRKVKAGMAKPAAIAAVVRSNSELHERVMEENKGKLGPRRR